jgi:ribonuclease P protein component
LPESIKSKGKLAKIYIIGKTITSADKMLKANYIISSHEKRLKIKYAVALSSKAGNSVWRNRLKRLIRESIRAEANLLREIVFFSKSSMSIIFSSGSITQSNKWHILLDDIKPAVSDILNQLIKTVKKDKKVIVTTRTDIQVDTR